MAKKKQKNEKRRNFSIELNEKYKRKKGKVEEDKVEKVTIIDPLL